MNRHLLRVYHLLPYPARCAAAGLFGMYLDRWRYDHATEELVQEALEREHWTSGQWRLWREERLAAVLHRAATEVPYYREQWAERRRRGDRCSWEILENWPILEKEELRRNPAQFLAADCEKRHMFAEHTSGTTGTPLVLWRSRETVRKWYALHEARTRLWHQVTRHDRWAIVGGQKVVPVGQRNPPFWVWNPGSKQLYLSAFHVAPARSESYLDALSQYKVKFILGYTASIATLAAEALRIRRRLPMKVVITNAEPVSEAQRSVIEEAFQCSVRETYGMAEIVAAASECEAGHLHDWPEAGIVEDAPDGQLIATGLMNADMPLIRYRSGDRKIPPASNAPCSCGRTLPLFGSVEGRLDDVLYLRDGRQIGRMDPVFKADLPLRESQIIQESLDRLRVRYVPAAEFAIDSPDRIAQSIRDFIGPMDIVFEQMDAIPREPNGKFRSVICRLPRNERPVAVASEQVVQ
jgi:phenylacetate-CoA ligase